MRVRVDLINMRSHLLLIFLFLWALGAMTLSPSWALMSEGIRGYLEILK